ncbi:unnamed protein product [Lactuca virosa]|uniref:ABC transporter domain-containing protein n=1 Tax=Lactuca virosa TaxID=75947 RepID=A0AAU9NLH7_9ASTR|nr:unnamed protein product [Lactuca virosa]
MSARIGVEDIPETSGLAPASPTLGELLKYVNEVNGDETTGHRVLEMNQMSNEPQPLPFVLAFSNLTYSVKVPSKFGIPAVLGGRNRPAALPAMAAEPVGGEKLVSRSKILLNEISGQARDGEILAVLGASGSGKSTLIDALANRISKGSLKGNITLNGDQLESRLLKVISAYVMQDDLLFPMLTVEETLMYAAEFRLPRSLSKTKKKLRVQALIDQLGLRNAAKTIIGDEGHRGVSGGERRRVSIGADIIHDPILLFLDEPTSGLDSTSAYMVVKVLQRIAQTGSIVIMSVHQPSYRLLGLLDRLLFLSRGQTVYSGSPANLPFLLRRFWPSNSGERKSYGICPRFDQRSRRFSWRNKKPSRIQQILATPEAIPTHPNHRQRNSDTWLIAYRSDKCEYITRQISLRSHQRP